MTHEPRAVKEIHEIRLKIQEQTKDMTSKEELAFYNNAVVESENRRGRKFTRPGERRPRKAI